MPSRPALRKQLGARGTQLPRMMDGGRVLHWRGSGGGGDVLTPPSLEAKLSALRIRCSKSSAKALMGRGKESNEKGNINQYDLQGILSGNEVFTCSQHYCMLAPVMHQPPCLVLGWTKGLSLLRIQVHLS